MIIFCCRILLLKQLFGLKLVFYESCYGLQKKKSLKFTHFVFVCQSINFKKYSSIIFLSKKKKYKQSQILMISFYDFLQESKLFDFGTTFFFVFIIFIYNFGVCVAFCYELINYLKNYYYYYYKFESNHQRCRPGERSVVG